MNKMWTDQKKFEDLFFKTKNLDFNNLSLDDKKKWTKEFYTHIIVELSEMIDKMQDKMHRNKHSEFNEGNLKESIVDSYKFILGLAQIWFEDFESFSKHFDNKTSVVNKRFYFEEIKNISNTKKDVVIVDIDGVLADLEINMFEVFNNAIRYSILYETALPTTKIEKIIHESKDEIWKCDWDNFKSTRDIKKALPSLYDKLKFAYRESPMHRYLGVIEGAKDFVDSLKSLGYTIIIITARPYEKHNNLWADTMYWLDKNKIKYDALYFDDKKHETILKLFPNKLNKIKFIVDDSLDICKNVEKIGIKYFNINHKEVTFKTIINEVKNEHI